MTPRQTGAAIILVGVTVVVVGILVWTGAFRWFGHLPGDIRIEKPGMRFYVPITSMLLLSLLLSLVFQLGRRLF
jgi:hypothetical protein